MPSAQTLWRTMHLSFANQEGLAATTSQLLPSIQERDADRIEQIERTVDIEAALDLAATATGLADHAWHQRMRAFGPGAADAIRSRLGSDWLRNHTENHSGILERYIGALRWYGPEGTKALIDCWESLDAYGRSLAAVVFGLNGAEETTDRIWELYQQAGQLRQKSIRVGALWGLIDLRDERVSDALVLLLVEHRHVYELFGFLSRAGDRRAVLPLLSEILSGVAEHQGDAMWALTGIAHRIGAEALTTEITMEGTASTEANRNVGDFVERLFDYSAADVEKHFELFYMQQS